MDFAFRIPSRKKHPCPQCGQEARGEQGDELCTQCHFYQSHPEEAPKYWTWTHGPNNTWLATAAWPENEPDPDTGLSITVHRKDGSTSIHTVLALRHRAYDHSARLRVVCEVA